MTASQNVSSEPGHTETQVRLDSEIDVGTAQQPGGDQQSRGCLQGTPVTFCGSPEVSGLHDPPDVDHRQQCTGDDDHDHDRRRYDDHDHDRRRYDGGRRGDGHRVERDGAIHGESGSAARFAHGSAGFNASVVDGNQSYDAIRGKKPVDILLRSHGSMLCCDSDANMSGPQPPPSTHTFVLSCEDTSIGCEPLSLHVEYTHRSPSCSRQAA